jgi:hypothetical protein
VVNPEYKIDDLHIKREDMSFSILGFNLPPLNTDLNKKDLNLLSSSFICVHPVTAALCPIFLNQDNVQEKKRKKSSKIFRKIKQEA